MTAAPSSTPLSVDYTGRDYYALRTQLIARVQERVPAWQGTDPNDFGLALIEAFSYMGDLVNYYIDRVANESFILTATQRESLLNIASMYGYKPANYVSSSTTLDITDTASGYKGQIGGAIIENGTVGAISGNYAKIIVPDNHPFTVAGPTNRISVNSMPSYAIGTVGDQVISYNTSVFNGTFPVAYVGYENFGRNVIWYRPSATVTNVAVLTASVTSGIGTGSAVTYQSVNVFNVGDKVTITGLGIASGSSLNLTAATITVATATYFTVSATAITGVSSGTGTATLPTSFAVTLSDTNRTIQALAGQKIVLRNVNVASGYNYNGKWVVSNFLDTAGVNPTLAIVSTLASDTIADPTAAKIVGSSVYYSAWNDFIVGETVTIAGATSTGYNLSNVAITAVKDVEAIVSRASFVTGSPGTITYVVSQQFAVDDYVTFRGIASDYNIVSAKDLGYNLTNQTVTAAASVTAAINAVTPSLPTSGYITYQTGAAHSFLVGDYVTLSGIANLANSTVTALNVYNLTSAKIVSVTSTTFVVQGYWLNAFDGPNSGSALATLYTATIAATVTGALQSTGSAVSTYFAVAKPGGLTTPTTTAFTAGTATAQVGGTWATSATAEIVYNNIPTLVTSGPYVTSIGSTVVPRGTQVSTQVTINGGTQTVYFSTQSDLVVPYRQTASVLALQGEDVSLRTANAAVPATKPYDIAGELLGYSDGTADQKLALKEIQVNPRYVRVFVDSGTAWEEWTQVEFIQDYSPSSKIFAVTVAADETVRVVFGDGISGTIPVKESGVKAVYIAGGGIQGNVGAGALSNWSNVFGVNASVISTMTVNNSTPATGGADPESDDSIRYNAPRSLRALNRAVTLDDFANLSLAIDGVVKSNAVADSRSSVTVYIAPSASGSGEETPGVDASLNNTTQMASYISLVGQYLNDKKQIGTTVTVLSPFYSYVIAAVQYSTLPQYNPSLVGTAIQLALLTGFSYDNADFGDVITPEEAEFKIRQVEGVSNAKVTSLYRSGGSGRNSLIGDPSELFVFTQANITVTPMSTDSALNPNITFAPLNTGLSSTGTAVISPVVNSGVYAYTLALPVGTTFLTATATPNVSTSTITVSNNAVSTTYPATSVPIAVVNGITVLVNVTAQDGITLSTYRFKVAIATS